MPVKNDPTITPPSKNVIQMFGSNEEPILLTGGEGQSYRAGNIVLKQVTDITQTNWIAEVLSSIEEDAFRVNKPVRTSDGDWICEDWQAFYYLEGVAQKGRWDEKIHLARCFQKSIARIARPDFIGKRNNPWEKADRMVWGIDLEEYGTQVSEVTSRLVALKQPLTLTEQLIHGDMTGNFLFHDALPPAIIDFSPYWRPPEYATAIIVVDAIVWEGADDSIVSALENTVDNNQLLLRAALWRIKTSEEFSKFDNRDLSAEVHHYHHFINVLLARMQ